MYHKLNSLICKIVLVALPVYAGVAHALDSDRTQPLKVEADTARINKKTGVSVYTGHVIIHQGTLRITASRIEVYTSNGGMNRIVAEGSPATYRQRPEKRDQDIVAEAGRMEYDAVHNRAVFLKKAILNQAGNTFKSDRIVYDIANDAVDAGKKEGGDRVIITIQPGKDAKPLLPQKAPK
jgi:lipopolysaccharide export system protein LptA